MTTLHDFTATTLAGEEKSLADYAGQVVLVVNTASFCGFTPSTTASNVSSGSAVVNTTSTGADLGRGL